LFFIVYLFHFEEQSKHHLFILNLNTIIPSLWTTIKAVLLPFLSCVIRVLLVFSYIFISPSWNKTNLTSLHQSWNKVQLSPLYTATICCSKNVVL